MTWLTWRQFRTQTWVALAALAVLAAVLAATGADLARMHTDSGLPTCVASNDCDYARTVFLRQALFGVTGILYWVGIVVMLVAPGLIGAFWGAPMIARELETGTFRLAFNQSVTRGRWLAAKLGLLGAASMATAGLFSLMVTLWSGHIDHAQANRFNPVVFATRGVVPIGYAAFAFVLGVVAGLLIRRTVPAMAVTLAVFAAVQIVMPLAVRPHLIPPVHYTAPLSDTTITGLLQTSGAGPGGPGTGGGTMTVTGAVDKSGAWVLANQTLTPTGKVFTGPADPRYCGANGSPRACIQWVLSQDLRQAVTYQPAGRYWAFQWYETGIFLALAALLSWFAFWWVRRRLT